MWRCWPALAEIGERMAMVIVDGDVHFHLYWRIDDYNVEDGGKLVLENGDPIGASGGPAGTSLGGNGPNLLICNEAGRLFLLTGRRLNVTH